MGGTLVSFKENPSLTRKGSWGRTHPDSFGTPRTPRTDSADQKRRESHCNHSFRDSLGDLSYHLLIHLRPTT